MPGSALTISDVLIDLDARIASLAPGLEIVATRRLGNRDEARDATQETLARLLARARSGGITCCAELAPIAYGIARHVIADMLRERRRESPAAGDPPSNSPGALDALVSEDERAAVMQALRRLSDSDQRLLRRCFVDGERIGHIAVEMGEPVERVRKRKSRALQRLAAVFGAAASRAGHESRTLSMRET